MCEAENSSSQKSGSAVANDNHLIMILKHELSPRGKGKHTKYVIDSEKEKKMPTLN